MPQFGQITPAQAFRLIGTPDAPPSSMSAPKRISPPCPV
jgi:hypothetical protein